MVEGSPALVNPFPEAVGPDEAREYAGVRPYYPEQLYQLLAEQCGQPYRVAVDVGAGTGQFTAGLVAQGLQVVAVEPSTAMRAELEQRPWAVRVQVVDATAEDTGLPSETADLVVWAQCAHWLDVRAASEEAARLLRPGGVLAVVANQMRVSVPWVHRLSRIMRSGDVVRADRPPRVQGPLTGPDLHQIPWAQSLTVEECLALARTRSSYLAASEPRRERMQANLNWYLRDHLGCDRELELPYTTIMWSWKKQNSA